MSKISMNIAHSSLLEEADEQGHDLLFRAEGRHRLLGGKSARLLREGDRVAVSQLLTGGMSLMRGVATITGTLNTHSGITFVMTAKHGFFQAPSSRLVLVERRD